MRPRVDSSSTAVGLDSRAVPDVYLIKPSSLDNREKKGVSPKAPEQSMAGAQQAECTHIKQQRKEALSNSEVSLRFYYTEGTHRQSQLL